VQGASTDNVYVGFSEFADQWQPYGNTANRAGSVNTITASTYPNGLFAERRGHQFYDGPAHMSNCHFYNFNPRVSEPLVRMPGSVQPVIWYHSRTNCTRTHCTRTHCSRTHAHRDLTLRVRL
jgi:hypothetical protein